MAVLHTFYNGDVAIKYGDFGRDEDPKQQVVLALHGLLQNHRNWGPKQANIVDPLVSAGFRVITPDLRGHGQSDKPKIVGSYGLRMVDDLVKLLDVLGVGKVHLIGHSYGGTLGVRFAVEHPNRVRSLIVASAGTGERKEFQDLLPRIHKMFKCLTCLFKVFCCGLCVSDPDPRSVYMVALEQEEVIVFTEEQVKLKALKIPVQGIVGAKDTTADPKGMQAFKEFIPDYECLVVDGVGHGGILFSDQFRNTSIDFFKRHRESSQS